MLAQPVGVAATVRAEAVETAKVTAEARAGSTLVPPASECRRCSLATEAAATGAEVMAGEAPGGSATAAAAMAKAAARDSGWVVAAGSGWAVVAGSGSVEAVATATVVEEEKAMEEEEGWDWVAAVGSGLVAAAGLGSEAAAVMDLAVDQGLGLVVAAAKAGSAVEAMAAEGYSRCNFQTTLSVQLQSPARPVQAAAKADWAMAAEEARAVVASETAGEAETVGAVWEVMAGAAGGTAESRICTLRSTPGCTRSMRFEWLVLNLPP